MSAMDIRRPSAVYFDTSVLCQLPADLTSPELAKLQAYASGLNVRLYIPEISAREWIAFHERRVRGDYQTARSALRALKKYLPEVPELTGNEPPIAESVKEVHSRHLVEAGIERIPTPTVEVAMLVDKAIRQEMPFQKGDKGFRDTLIALTIAEHAKAFAGHFIVVAAQDGVFKSHEVLTLWRASGVEPLVATTTAETVQKVDSLLDDATRRFFERELAEIREYLVSERDRIFEYVQTNAQASEAFIAGRFTDKPLFGTVERYRGMTASAIGEVSRGHVRGDREEQDDIIPITFDVDVELDLLVTTVAALSDVLGPQLSLGKEWDREPFRLGGTAPLITTDTRVKRTIPVEATIRRLGPGRFGDLTIERLRTY